MRLPFALFAALATITSPVAAFAEVAPLPAPADGTVLEVVAEGKVSRAPDVVVINAGVVTQASTAAQALADNGRQVARVMAALKATGLADRDIRSANISLQPQYRNADNTLPVVTGYQAMNSVSIRFRDVARAGSILDTLVREGANQIDGPMFQLDRPGPALDEARADALTKASARAALYARLSGLRVDRILSISENPTGAMPILANTRGFAVQTEADAGTQVIPGEQDVTLNLSVRFLLR